MKGFTLIEALIAVTIITFAVAGPLFTANRAIVSAQSARLQLTASHLAQEGIEHVRALRDDAYLSAYQVGGAAVGSTAWNNFKTAIAVCGTACAFDTTLPIGVGNGYSLQECLGTCSPLYLTNNGTTDIYTQQSAAGTQTVFTREIQSVSVSSDDERIVSTVTWYFHGSPYKVTISDHLTPWQ